MELSQLRYFITVAQTQHLTRAAETLNISQPALSKAISRLEAELHTTLFDRTPNRIILNKNGRDYLEQVQKALKLLDDASDLGQSGTGIHNADVNIMTSCSGLIQPAIREFIIHHKEIRYREFLFSADRLVDQLESGILDMAVTVQPGITSRCIWTSLAKDELYIIVSPNHPFSRRDFVTIHELAAEPLIINNSMLCIHDIVSETFEQMGIRPNIAYELTNDPLTELLLSDNQGVVFVPGLPVDLIPGMVSSLRRIPIKDHPFAYELGILKLKGGESDPCTALLEGFLLDWYQDPGHLPRPGQLTDKT